MLGLKSKRELRTWSAASWYDLSSLGSGTITTDLHVPKNKKTTIRKSLWEKHKDLTFSKHQNNKKDKENVGTCSLWTTYYIIQFNFDSRQAPHQPIIMYYRRAFCINFWPIVHIFYFLRTVTGRANTKPDPWQVYNCDIQPTPWRAWVGSNLILEFSSF